MVSICVCWPPKRRVYNITSSSLVHLLLLCCLLKVSQYQLELIHTASVHIVKGTSQHIHNSLWVSLDLHGILAIVWTPAYSGFYLCVLATQAPCLQHHVIVATAQEVSPTSLLPAKSVAVSARADTQPLSTLSRVPPSISIIGHEPVGLSLSLSLSVTIGSFRWSRLLSSDPVAVRVHTFFPRGGAFFCWSVLLLECASAWVSFCWRGWRTLLLAWLEELRLEVSIESTRLLRGPD